MTRYDDNVGRRSQNCGDHRRLVVAVSELLDGDLRICGSDNFSRG
jgi:hypothetical protein